MPDTGCTTAVRSGSPRPRTSRLAVRAAARAGEPRPGGNRSAAPNRLPRPLQRPQRRDRLDARPHRRARRGRRAGQGPSIGDPLRCHAQGSGGGFRFLAELRSGQGGRSARRSGRRRRKAARCRPRRSARRHSRRCRQGSGGAARRRHRDDRVSRRRAVARDRHRRVADLAHRAQRRTADRRDDRGDEGAGVRQPGGRNPRTSRADEIGAMAGAVEVFKQNAIEKQAFEEREASRTRPGRGARRRSTSSSASSAAASPGSSLRCRTPRSGMARTSSALEASSNETGEPGQAGDERGRAGLR